MRCFNATLDTPITNACPSIVGVTANSWILPRKYVKNKVITDAECTFDIISNVIPVYVPGDLPYKPTSNGTNNSYGLQKFVKTTEFLFVENTTLSQLQILQLQNDSWVQVFKDNNGQNLVFGIESGLRFKTSSQDFNSLDTHGGIVVTMEEANVNTPMLFTTDAIYNWIDYELITGLTIPTNGKISVEVDSDKTAYVIQPDGSLLTSVAGIIDTNLGGNAGAVTLIVPKNTSILHLGSNGSNGSIVIASDFIGGLKTNLATTLDCSYCQSLTSISVPNATYLNCAGCTSLTSISAPKVTYLSCNSCPILTSISASNATHIYVYDCSSVTSTVLYSILDNSYSLFLKGQLTGAANLGGTTTEIDVFDDSSVHGINYQSMITAMIGWYITVNAA